MKNIVFGQKIYIDAYVKMLDHWKSVLTKT